MTLKILMMSGSRLLVHCMLWMLIEMDREADSSQLFLGLTGMPS